MTEEQKHRNELWAKALEANTKKARGKMYGVNGGRCCLAVAQDVAIENGLTLPSERDEHLVVTPEVAKWFGWENQNPILIYKDGKEASAAYMNDYINGKGLEHVEIARCVRETFCKP